MHLKLNFILFFLNTLIASFSWASKGSSFDCSLHKGLQFKLTFNKTVWKGEVTTDFCTVHLRLSKSKARWGNMNMSWTSFFFTGHDTTGHTLELDTVWSACTEQVLIITFILQIAPPLCLLVGFSLVLGESVLQHHLILLQQRHTGFCTLPKVGL